MIDLIEQHRQQIEALCRQFGVRRLELFGSAASGQFDPKTSDVDFFVEFDRRPDLRPRDSFSDSCMRWRTSSVVTSI